MKEFNPTKKINKPDKTVITFRIESKKLEILDRIANNKDISRNELLLQCIDFALENLPKDEKRITKF